MFEYEQTSWSPKFQELSVVTDEDCFVYDVVYPSPIGGTVPAYLVCPINRVAHAGMIYLHPGQGNRTTFLSEAKVMASIGSVCMLIDAPYLREEVSQKKLTAADIALQTILDIRRGVDLLQSIFGIHSDHIGFVGHSLGATYGGVIAGCEHRIKAYVLIAGYASQTDWHRNSKHPLAIQFRTEVPEDKMKNFYVSMEPIDAVRHIQNASPSTLLFQFATQDEFVDKRQSELYYATASEPKRAIWYNTDHLFTGCEDARKDRVLWIAETLGLVELPERNDRHC